MLKFDNLGRIRSHESHHTTTAQKDGNRKYDLQLVYSQIRMTISIYNLITMYLDLLTCEAKHTNDSLVFYFVSKTVSKSSYFNLESTNTNAKFCSNIEGMKYFQLRIIRNLHEKFSKLLDRSKCFIPKNVGLDVKDIKKRRRICEPA